MEAAGCKETAADFKSKPSVTSVEYISGEVELRPGCTLVQYQFVPQEGAGSQCSVQSALSLTLLTQLCEAAQFHSKMLA